MRLSRIWRHLAVVVAATAELTSSVGAGEQGAEASRLLLAKNWPEVAITVESTGARGVWRITADRGPNRPRTGFQVDATTLGPTSAYLHGGNLLLVECDESGPGAEFVVIDLRAERVVDHFYAAYPAVSPDAQFVLFERRNPRGEEDHVGSVLLLYDVGKSKVGNRSTRAKRGVDVGIPVYPEYFRSRGAYTIPLGNDGGGGKLMSPSPVWLDARTVGFGYRTNAGLEVVVLSVDASGKTSVGDTVINPSSVIKDAAEPEAARRLIVEEVSLIGSDTNGRKLRVRLGPAADVKVRWLEVIVQ